MVLFQTPMLISIVCKEKDPALMGKSK